MKLTATSNAIIPTNTAKGSSVAIETNKLLVNILNKKEERMAKRVWVGKR